MVFAVGTNGIDPSRVTVTALDTPYWAAAPVYYSATFVVLVRVPASNILHVPFMSCHAMPCDAKVAGNRTVDAITNTSMGYCSTTTLTNGEL